MDASRSWRQPAGFQTAGEYTVDITLTVTFAANAQVSQDTSIDLDGMALTLQQTA